MNKFTVVFVLDVDDTPAVFAATNRLAVDDHVSFGSNDGKRNRILMHVSQYKQRYDRMDCKNPNFVGELSFILFKFVRVIWVESNVVVDQFFADLDG